MNEITVVKMWDVFKLRIVSSVYIADSTELFKCHLSVIFSSIVRSQIGMSEFWGLTE